MRYERERDVAVAAVLKACRLCASVRRDLVSPATVAKKDKSPVTVADFGSQAVVAMHLAEAMPEVPIVGEEDAGALRGEAGSALRDTVMHHVRCVLPVATEDQVLAAIDRGTYGGGSSGRHWALDPIDGTKGFLRNEQYAVALALIEDGEVVLGVLGCPNLPQDGGTGCLFVAFRGQGAVVRSLDRGDERPIRVSDVSNPAAAVFCESVESGHSSHDDAARIAARLGVTAPPVRMDSQCKYAAVARGDASIYLRLPTRADYREKIWDHAAGWMIVTEAGGRVTDTRGEPLDFSRGRTLDRNAGVIATNGRLHDRVLEVVGTSSERFTP